jgi:lipopolysaccharide transport system ATP-binding protein
MSDIVISVESLWKQYRYGVLSHRALYKDLQSWWARYRGKEDPNSPISLASSSVARHPSAVSDPDHFWALQNINFEVKQGEVLGIIGKNGAGKSTLLKIMSRVTAPTRGLIKIKGRVASLLEVGTGFHPELTGRENIFLNGAILGMTKNEIKDIFEEIVDFAEIEKFVDTPVKRYSSGMYVRLAFAVAAHLEPEILLVDEVLAVGDMAFQKKCIGKIRDVSSLGRTVLFVSHNMMAVSGLCHKAIVIERSKVGFIGPSKEAIEWYLSESSPVNERLSSNTFSGPLSKRLHINLVSVNHQTHDRQISLSLSSEVVIRISGYSDEDIRQCDIVVGIEKDGIRIFTLHDTLMAERLSMGDFSSEVSLPPFLLRPGEYTVSMGSNSESLKEWMWGRNIIGFIVIDDRSAQEQKRRNKRPAFSFLGKRLQNR